jgi:tetratricopeptide (TPR) repeat protein
MRGSSRRPAHGWPLIEHNSAVLLIVFLLAGLDLPLAVASAEAEGGSYGTQQTGSRPAAAAPVSKPAAADPIAPVNAAIARAEAALAGEERQLADSRYREALYTGWMLLGAIASADGRYPDARDAFQQASAAIVDSGDALQSLALVDLRLNDAEAALPILTKLVAARPEDIGLKRLLAQALIVGKRPAEAVQMLEEAHGAAPHDLETTFALANAYLRVKKPDAARPLFAKLNAARPVAETYVLIGRAYRDAALYADARAAFQKALDMNPRVRHAHYYLGSTAVMEGGVVRVDEAIQEFQREIAIAPGDPATSLLLGMALVEAHREQEALPHLDVAARQPDAGWRTFQYLGRCQLALGQARSAADAFRKAIDLSADIPAESRLGNLHYQLAQSLRQAGDTAAADAEFKAASESAADRLTSTRDSLQRYLAGAGDLPGAPPPELSFDAGAIGTLAQPARAALRAQTATALARVYLNLGILQVQEKRYARAVALMQSAAALDSNLPRLQYSLGVAAFNAEQYAVAVAALDRASAADPANADARRMLALASLNARAFDRAVDLLKTDPDLQRDPSLQYAYGIALVHSGHAADAERLFSSLLAAHRDNPQLTVLLGEAHAEQGDYDGAIAALQRAVQLKPDIADANRTLGVIYLQQGKLPEAVAALRAELVSHPSDASARYTLAMVLDQEGHQDEALTEVSRVVQARPQDADARYLIGKILLARGSAADATEHLEIAARLAPHDANIQFQLAQAYQKVGRTADAQKAFERYQALKEKRRGGDR